jgi:hypothetical protein
VKRAALQKKEDWILAFARMTVFRRLSVIPRSKELLQRGQASCLYRLKAWGSYAYEDMVTLKPSPAMGPGDVLI